MSSNLHTCRYCHGELYGGRGDYWHVQPTGTVAEWPMRCPDGKHLGQPLLDDEYPISD